MPWWCFPPSAFVSTQRGRIRICDLKPQDRIPIVEKLKNGDLKCKETEHLTFLHFEPDMDTEFVTIKCDNGSEIDITSDHLIFKVLETGSWKAVAANKICVGDTLIHLDNYKQVSFPHVIHIGTKVMKGVASPLTMKGTIVINNLLASCYADINSHSAAHKSMALLRFRHQINSKTKKNKLAEATEPKRGIHHYAKVLMALRNAFN